MVKEYLSQKGIPYLNKDVSLDPAAAREMVQLTGQNGVPVIVIDGQAIVGFDRARLEQVISQAQVAKPVFGAAVADASKHGGESGAYVGNVHPNSAAARAGLAAGDIINEINGQTVSTAADLTQVLANLPKASHLSIAFLRAGKPVRAEVT